MGKKNNGNIVKDETSKCCNAKVKRGFKLAQDFQSKYCVKCGKKQE